MPARKISDEQATTIRRRIEAGETLRAVARDYGVAWNTIRNICTRQYRLPLRRVA